MWIICMTTDSDGYHTEMKFKRNVPYHFIRLNVIPQKTKFNIECFQEVAKKRIFKMMIFKGHRTMNAFFQCYGRG